jgi:hypothetical protein
MTLPFIIFFGAFRQLWISHIPYLTLPGIEYLIASHKRGEWMALKCPKCRAENPETKRFCGECGTRLGTLEETPASFTKTLETPIEILARGTLFADRYEFIEEPGRASSSTRWSQSGCHLKATRPWLSP